MGEQGGATPTTLISIRQARHIPGEEGNPVTSEQEANCVSTFADSSKMGQGRGGFALLRLRVLQVA